MYSLCLLRSTSMFPQRAFALSLAQNVRFKSTTTKSVLFSPSPRKLEVSVTPKRVTLKFGEDPATLVTPPATKAASTTKSLLNSIEAKIKQGINAMGEKVTKVATDKTAGPVKKVKATKTTKTPKASKSNEAGPSKSNSTVNPTDAVPCWVDASCTHIAIVIGNQYKVFALNNGWMSPARDINWAETAAFELLAQILAKQGRTGVVQVNSDSATALRAMAGERVRVPEIMESSRRTGDILKTSMFTIKGVKVSRTTNLADRFTHGKTRDGYEQMKGDIVVPEALVPYVTAV
ncbi:unnamed protein product [Rhizoctonia solani]|uniref:Uncharacterized protein n=1 Tax=Rhizoctonia solani TaxID=456999 RepID=A0A8H3CRR8_9AGAM|nr:unnamed protein product [Rhizoctonia solani]